MFQSRITTANAVGIHAREQKEGEGMAVFFLDALGKTVVRVAITQIDEVATRLFGRLFTGGQERDRHQ